MKNIQSLEEFANESVINEGIKITDVSSSIKARKLQLKLNKDTFEIDVDKAKDIKSRIESYLEIF